MCTKTTGIRMQLSCIGEQLPCTREPGNSKDPIRCGSGEIECYRVTSTMNDQVCTSARTTARGASGGRIRLGMANQNPQSVKLFLRNFAKGQSAKILSLENLALYGNFKLTSHLCNVYNIIIL